jgi:RHS repeat-associated protein
VSSYEYDGDGRRVKQVNSDGTIHYMWSSVLGEPVVELTSGGVYRAYVYGPGGGQMIAMQSYDGGFYWVHTDHLGSGRKITNSSGTVVYRGEFDPHGQALYEWHSSGQTYLNSHKYTGYERDWATNLNYAKARTYHHNRGRFMQPDPLGLGAAVLSDPQSLNRYSYVGNDPANFTDPLGLACFARYLVTTTYSDGQVIGETWQFIGIFCDGGGGGYYEPIAGGGGGGGGGDPTAGTQQNQQKPCPPDAKALAEVDKLLQKSGLDKLISEKTVSQSGKGYILKFHDPGAAQGILGNRNLFASGGSVGGSFHKKELEDNFGKGGKVSDFRSFNGGNTALGDRSLQAVLYSQEKNILGAYVDTDRFNPNQDVVGALGHFFGEVLPFLFNKARGKDC